MASEALEINPFLDIEEEEQETNPFLSINVPGSVPEPPPGPELTDLPVSTTEITPRERQQIFEEGEIQEGIDIAAEVQQMRDVLDGLHSRGIQTRGAPVFARILIGLSPERSDAALQRGLSTFFQSDIKISTDEETGVRYYIDPDTKDKVAVDPPRPDIGDIYDIIPELSVLGPETVGFLSGTAAGGGPITGVTAGAFSAFAGEFSRLVLGRKAGVHEMSDAEMFAQAGEVAGISFGGGAAGTAMISFGRGIARLLGSPVGAIDSGEANLLLRKLDEGEEILDPIRQQTGRDVNFNATQATQDAVIAREQQQAMKSDEIFRTFEKQDEELQEALIEFYDENARNAIFAEPTDAFASGRNIQEAANLRPDRARTRMDEVVGEAEDQLSQMRMFTENEIDALSIGSGKELRQAVIEEIDRSKKLISQSADRLEATAKREFGDNPRPINAVALEETALAIEAKAANNILRTLNPEDRNIAGKTLEALVDRGSSKARFGNLTFEEAAETSSFLKSLLRRIDDRVETNVDRGAVKRLIAALDQDIAASLERYPNTAIAYDGFKELVHSEKERLQRNAIARIVQVRNADETVLDENVFNEVFKTKEAGLRMAEILRTNPAMLDEQTRILYSNARDIMRNGIKQKYNRAVFSGNKPNMRAHRKFLEDNKEVLDAFFSPSEVASFQRIGQLSERVDELLNAKKFLDKKLRNSVVGRLVKPGDDPLKIFKRIWNQGEVTDISAIRRQLRDYPELWEEFKATAQAEMRREMMTRSGNRDILDFNKLGDILQKKQNQLTLIYGKEYVDNLKILHSAVRRANEVVTPAPSDATAVPLVDMARAYFRPLSARGKIFTAGLKIRKRRFESVVAEAMTSPEKLRILIELNKASHSSQKVAALLGQLGAYSLIPDEDFFVQDVQDAVESVNRTFSGMRGL